MNKVYYLEKYPNNSNAFTVSRSETWSFQLDKSFEDKEQAKHYVREKNRYTPEFVLQSEGIQ